MTCKSNFALSASSGRTLWRATMTRDWMEGVLSNALLDVISLRMSLGKVLSAKVVIHHNA